jgi:threonine aldolase
MSDDLSADGTVDDPRALHAQAQRWLSGHGFESAQTVLAGVLDAVDPDENQDQYGGGAIIEEFECEVASLLGKESAVFVPSGTMAQQIALRIWSERKGCSTVAFHPTCHLEVHEQQGYRRLHGLHGRLVGEAHRLITLDDLQMIAEPVGTLLLELPQREIGGRLPSWDDLTTQVNWARERGMALHMDGARLWEAGPFYDRSYAEIAALFDTVYVSFYKGLGGLAGSILAGPADVIAESKVWIRRHGGNLIHLFPYVVSARAALHTRLDRFGSYYERARALAASLCTLDGVRITPHPPQTCMMHIHLDGDVDGMTAEAHRIAREEGVFLFGSLRPTTVPNWSTWELTIGDAATAISDEEATELVARVVAAGRGN